MLFPYFQRLLRQPQTPLHKASIVREAWKARWGSGVSLSRCHSSVAFLSLFPRLCFLHGKIFHCNEAAIRSPCMLSIPFCLSNHPSPSFPLSSLKSLHSSLQLSSGKRLALWGRGSQAALMRLRCRALCVCVCVCGKGGRRGLGLLWTGNSPL